MGRTGGKGVLARCDVRTMLPCVPCGSSMCAGTGRTTGMRQVKRLLMAGGMVALTAALLGAPAAAAGSGKVVFVQGTPGTKVDICVGSNEVVSNLAYGKYSTRTLAAGSRTRDVPLLQGAQRRVRGDASGDLEPDHRRRLAADGGHHEVRAQGRRLSRHDTLGAPIAGLWPHRVALGHRCRWLEHALRLRRRHRLEPDGGRGLRQGRAGCRRRPGRRQHVPVGLCPARPDGRLRAAAGRRARTAGSTKRSSSERTWATSRSSGSNGSGPSRDG